ncbi:hypothetical protein J6590_064985 [Homalodisca vitripennis]|nr:hypothetical protein J6590_064985 [Homalodisca vitripennis]
MEASFLTELENPGVWCLRPPMMKRQQKARVLLLDLVSEKRRTCASIMRISQSGSHRSQKLQDAVGTIPPIAKFSNLFFTTKSPTWKGLAIRPLLYFLLTYSLARIRFRLAAFQVTFTLGVPGGGRRSPIFQMLANGLFGGKPNSNSKGTAL